MPTVVTLIRGQESTCSIVFSLWNAIYMNIYRLTLIRGHENRFQPGMSIYQPGENMSLQDNSMMSLFHIGNERLCKLDRSSI